MDISYETIYPYETLYIVNHNGVNKVIDQYALADIPSSELAYPDFTGDKDGIPSGNEFGEGLIIVSVKDDTDNNGSLDSFYNAYFAAHLNVRVAKPAIATTGGGLSVVTGDDTTGDVAVLTQGLNDHDDNTNFVGTSL